MLELTAESKIGAPAEGVKLILGMLPFGGVAKTVVDILMKAIGD